jgi:hypothetical protein
MQGIRTWGVRLVVLVVVVELAWVVFANLLLSTGLAERLINRRPEELRVHWERARTWYPARVHACGLVYEQHTGTMDIEVRASKVAASLRILPLLALRGVLDEVDVRDLGVVVVREAPAGPEPAPERAGPGLRMAVEDVEIHGVERLSYNDITIARGELSIRGSAAVQVRGPLELRDAIAEWRNARITVGKETVADSISLGFRGDVTPFHPGLETGPALLEKVSGAVDIHGDSRDLRPLHMLLQGVEWIERLDGAGDVAVHMILDGGRLQPGTDVDVVATDLELWFLGFAAEGSGRVSVDVSESGGDRRGQLHVVFEGFGISRQGAPEPLARGSGLTFSASGRDLGFSADRAGLDVVLDLPGSEFPDVAALANALPAGLGVEVLGGRAKLSGHLEVQGREAEAKGLFQIDGTDLAGRFRDMTFAMDLAFATRISGRDLDAFDIELAGTEVRLFNGAFDSEEAEVDDGWWMTIAIPEGLTNLAPPVTVNAELDLSMRDSSAILAAFAEVNRWIHHFDRFLTVRDVEGNAWLGIEGPRVSLRDLSLTGDRLEVLGELELAHGEEEGIFWGKLGAFSLGVERSGEESDFKLVNSRAWYDEQYAARWADREGPSVRDVREGDSHP